MAEQRWTPDDLMKLSGGYWAACALHAGLRLDLFTALGEDRSTAEDVARRLAASRRGTAMLLNALCALGLLVKEGNLYANTSEALQFLHRRSPAFLGHILLHHHFLMPSWARLPEAVLAGKPVRVRSSHTDEAAEREAFLMGMANIASGLAPKVAELVDLAGRSRLLDLGGGPGTYAIHFCQKNPGLTATVFDLPTTRPFAEATIARFGIGDRVSFRPGDFYADDYPGGFDAVWISQILHSESPDECRTLLGKAARALVPGGVLLIHEFYLDDTLDRPLHPALFALNMLVGTDHGQAYSEGQVRQMMAEAGFKDIRRLDFANPSGSGILSGIKG
jgi:SAM-dependent methyltransferase